MYFNRRNFLRSASILASFSLSELDVLAAKKIAANSSTIADDDENYWRNVRQLFPLSKDLTYLNNGTMGPSPYPVIEAMQKGIMDNDKHALYGGWEKLVAKLAAFVGADEDEIALTHNVTEGINIVCWGLPLRKRDEIIMTNHEHVGNALPWLNRQRLHGITIKTFTPGNTADETLERIRSLITRRTRVIAIPHMPCTQGQVLPVKEICALANERGIFSAIDGAHGPGMMPIDLHDMGCDTYASCSHKWMLGPKGTGFLYVSKKIRDMVQAYFVGGGSGGNVDWDMVNQPATMGNYSPTAHRYYGGTQSLALYKGVEASIDFIENIGMDNIHRRVKYLGKYTQEQLMTLGDKVEILTPIEERSRCAVNGFRIKGMEPGKVYNECNNNKIRIRIVPENNLDSLRVSTHIYNNPGEIDSLIEVLKLLV